MRKYFIIIVLLLTFIAILPQKVWGDQLEDINRELDKLKQDLAASQNATKPLEADLTRLQKQLDAIKLQITVIDAEVIKKEKDLKKGEKALTIQKTLLDLQIFEYYKNIKKTQESFLHLLVGNFDDFKNYFYQEKVTDQNKQSIVRIILYIKGLEEKKKNLVIEKESLAKIKVEVDKQSTFLAGQVGEAKKYQAELSGKIAQLSAQQQSLVAAKLATIAVPRSAETSIGGCSNDLTNGKDPGFSPRIGFFSFGANTHGNGMNQYGARGRAKDNQNEEQLLQFYYPNMSLKKDYDQGIQIQTTSGWSGSIEEYVKRIYEMPDSWTDNNLAALKAQAVAARTYALSYKVRAEKNNRDPKICTNEGCQVFKDSPKGGNWETAVNATAGWVLMDGGDPGFTEYASTHGGYVRNIGKFDGSGGNPGNFDDLKSRAYDRESPWFHCDWGARNEYGGTAWLKGWEVADIANVIMLAQRDSGTGSHLSQTDKGIPDTWDAEKVKSELRNRGGKPFDNVTSVSTGTDFGSGVTTSVSVSGDAGSVSFEGSEWKDWFNLRAPANIQIKSRLYNVE